MRELKATSPVQRHDRERNLERRFDFAGVHFDELRTRHRELDLVMLSGLEGEAVESASFERENGAGRGCVHVDLRDDNVTEVLEPDQKRHRSLRRREAATKTCDEVWSPRANVEYKASRCGNGGNRSDDKRRDRDHVRSGSEHLHSAPHYSRAANSSHCQPFAVWIWTRPSDHVRCCVHSGTVETAVPSPPINDVTL